MILLKFSHLDTPLGGRLAGWVDGWPLGGRLAAWVDGWPWAELGKDDSPFPTI